MDKFGKITTPEQRQKLRQYYQTHKHELARKAKKRNRDQKQGTKRKKSRIGTAGGGYSFIDNGGSSFSTPKIKSTTTSFSPTSYQPQWQLPSYGIKVGSSTCYYAGPNRIETLKKGSWVTDMKEKALILAVDWSPEDLVDMPANDEIPSRLNFIDPYLAPHDHPLFLYEVLECKLTEGLTGHTGFTKNFTRVKLIEEYPSWKTILLGKSNEHI